MRSFEVTLVTYLILFIGDSSQVYIKSNEVNTESLKIVSREEWGARKPKSIEFMTNPVPFVIIHHSYEPGPCWNETECKEAMRSMQNFHMDDRKFFDIGYSFGVGSDGRVYEGRGWTRVGAHAPVYNFKSIGICTIGDWTTEVPPENQLQTVKNLIEMGIEDGWISKDYKLLGHRQTRPTECPGQAYFDVIKTWDHFSPIPEVNRTIES